MEEAWTYAKERKTFGKPISKHQSISFIADRLHNLHNILIWADLQELASTWFRKTCTCAGSCGALPPGDINRSAWSTHHRKHDPSIGAPILQLKR